MASTCRRVTTPGCRWKTNSTRRNFAWPRPRVSSSITSWALTIPASCDLSGHQLVGASKWIGNASGEYKWNLDNGFEPYVTASYAFRSKAVGTVEDSDYGQIPSYAEVNFSTGLRAATTGSPGCSASATCPTRPGTGNPGISERRVPEKPGAGIPVAGSASRLGRYGVAACACVGQRQTG